MMDTPIYDFVRNYSQMDALRLHMPGHKGKGMLGVEKMDITEIAGGDSLYEASGIIRKSEENASRLFGCPTFYSTEGCSQCIRAMLYLAVLDAKSKGRHPRIAAARNVHKTFLSAAALLDLDVAWLWGEENTSYLSCHITAGELEEFFAQGEEKPTAVYVTSPDYLGNTQPISELAQVCHRHGSLLLVDNAHGSYLRFLQPSRHPMDQGADICCDSAHKTLPVLTGGAYLHIREERKDLVSGAKNALALFGSTSPSYLILQSLDCANAYLAGTYGEKLSEMIRQLNHAKETLQNHGYALQGDEPLKLTVAPKSYGYTGMEIGEILQKKNLFCEFSDPDFVVFMLTPENGEGDLAVLIHALLSIPRKPEITVMPPVFHPCKKVKSIREAVLSPGVCVPVQDSIGKVLTAPSVGCPPAVPIVVCGEEIDGEAAECFAYYGIETCTIERKISDESLS